MSLQQQKSHHSITARHLWFPPGRLVELSGQGASSACSSAAATVVLRAQEEGETVAWIQPEPGRLFPPDLHRSGIDLESLVVLRIPATARAFALPKAAEILLRSGGFGLVVVDFRGVQLPRGNAWQTRLLGLLRQHHARALLLTNNRVEQASLGPLIALRLWPHRQVSGTARFSILHRPLKDKTGLFPEEFITQHRAFW